MIALPIDPSRPTGRASLLESLAFLSCSFLSFLSLEAEALVPRVWGWRFRVGVWGLGCRVQGLGLRVEGLPRLGSLGLFSFLSLDAETLGVESLTPLSLEDLPLEEDEVLGE